MSFPALIGDREGVWRLGHDPELHTAHKVSNVEGDAGIALPRDRCLEDKVACGIRELYPGNTSNPPSHDQSSVLDHLIPVLE